MPSSNPLRYPVCVGLPRLAAAGLCSLLALSSVEAQNSVEPRAFESMQTHALDLRADGLQLYVVNTPDSRLSVYDLRIADRPRIWREIRTASEPVAVASRQDDEVWVVCQLSDCVQVIDVERGVVTATIPVSDEPMDVVFSGNRAFVSCSTEREVMVIDTGTLSVLGTVPVFCDDPGPLAVSANGASVYVASRMSGNDTTIVAEHLAPPQPPPTNPMLPPAPSVGLIVDSEDPTWTAAHGALLPDYDVFEIDAQTMNATRRVHGVGTVLLDLCVDPIDGSLLVVNTEARNLETFEPVLRGHAIDSRLTHISSSDPAAVTHTDLNPGVDYGLLPNPGALATAISQPTGVTFAPDGQEIFVASFGTDRIAVLDRSRQILARIEVGSAGGPTTSRTMRGPRSLAHHPSRPLLYVHNRLRNSLSIIDTTARREIAEIEALHDPVSSEDKEARGFLYDARLSGNGTMSCASCHVDARFDNVSWDLGDPGGDLTQAGHETVHPMKGPMFTQTLQGLEGTEPLHWRGDKPTFQDFNVAFDGLMGGNQLAPSDMDDYAEFADTIHFPPNPNRNLDDSLPNNDAVLGENLFANVPFGGAVTCVACHSFPTGSNFFVFAAAPIQEPQPFETAQLRNLYKRTGRDPDPATGESTSGFGILHDGSHLSIREFLTRPVFSNLAQPSAAADRARIEEFINAWDTGTKPLVGFARTYDQSNYPGGSAPSDLNLAMMLAGMAHGDLVVRGQLDGQEVGFLYQPQTGDFAPADTTAPPVLLADLELALRQGRGALTFLGTMPNEGVRVGLDRDQDGSFDREEAPIPYGQSTTGCEMTLRANSDSFVGNDQFALIVEGAQPLSLGALLVAFGPADLQALGIDFLVDSATSVSVSIGSDADGTSLAELPIPNNPNLTGLPLYSQAFFVGCGPFGLASTNGLEFTIVD
ncbi:MAG: hypothetical protein AAF196_16905 [Planctomycetota bacterium]